MARPKKRIEDKAVRQSVSMDPAQLCQVVEYCQRNDRTIAWVVRKAIDAFLKAEAAEDRVA